MERELHFFVSSVSELETILSGVTLLNVSFQNPSEKPFLGLQKVISVVVAYWEFDYDPDDRLRHLAVLVRSRVKFKKKDFDSLLKKTSNSEIEDIYCS